MISIIVEDDGRREVSFDLAPGQDYEDVSDEVAEIVESLVDLNGLAAQHSEGQDDESDGDSGMAGCEVMINAGTHAGKLGTIKEVKTVYLVDLCTGEQVHFMDDAVILGDPVTDDTDEEQPEPEAPETPPTASFASDERVFCHAPNGGFGTIISSDGLGRAVTVDMDSGKRLVFDASMVRSTHPFRVGDRVETTVDYGDTGRPITGIVLAIAPFLVRVVSSGNMLDLAPDQLCRVTQTPVPVTPAPFVVGQVVCLNEYPAVFGPVTEVTSDRVTFQAPRGLERRPHLDVRVPLTFKPGDKVRWYNGEPWFADVVAVEREGLVQMVHISKNSDPGRGTNHYFRSPFLLPA